MLRFLQVHVYTYKNVPIVSKVISDGLYLSVEALRYIIS